MTAMATTDALAEIDPDALLALRFVAEEARRRRVPRTTARPGPFVTRRRGRGSETDDVRPWAHGDDVRHVDRNVTARTGTPHVRTFRDERERTTMLVADFRPPMLFGTRRAFLSVAAAEFLALVGWSAASEGGRIALVAVTAEGVEAVRPAVGERAMIAVVGGLARAHRVALAGRSRTTADLSAHLAAAARMTPAGGAVVLASALDVPGADFDETVRRIGHRADLAVALVVDAFERAAPTGRYPFLDPTGRRGVGAVAGGRAAGADPRPARLDALGVPHARVDADAAPQAMIPALEALHDPR